MNTLPNIEVRSLEIGDEIFILCCSAFDLYGIRTFSKDRLNVLRNIPSATAYNPWSSTTSKGVLHLSNAVTFPVLFSGTAGDALSYHRGRPFTTKDQDNDTWSKNCAVGNGGAWWYGQCYDSNLNGLYLHGQHSSKRADGITWNRWKGYYYSAKRAEMKIRPVKF